MDQGSYRKHNMQEDLSSQGRYGENTVSVALTSWICPNCETVNTEGTCFLCGYQRVNNTQKKTTSKRLVIGLIACILVVGVALFVYTSNSRKYDRACTYLSQEQYEEASQLFESLGTYQDSQEQYQQATYKWAQSLLNENEFGKAESLFEKLDNYKDSRKLLTQTKYTWAEYMLEKKAYDQALEKLEEMPYYGKADNLVKEVRYQKALAHLEKKEYAEAYSEFSQIPVKYKATESYLCAVKKQWGRHIIENSLWLQTTTFENAVRLTEEESVYLYGYLINQNYYTPFSTDSSMNADFKTRSSMLDILTNDIPHKETLKKLFSEFRTYNAESYIKENHDLFVELWDLPVVQNIIKEEWNICVWLLGNWKADTGKYIKFFQKDNDPESIWTDHTLPWTAKPSGTAHWDIVDMEYMWTDEDYNELAKVYRFNFLGPDIMEVYCYVNGQTYTVKRG